MRLITRPILGILLILINFLIRLENALGGRFPKEIESSIDSLQEVNKQEKIE